MSQYSFRFYDGDDISVTEGVECKGARAVRLHMLDIARLEITAEGEGATWSMEALNDRGIVVGSVDFGLSSSTDYRR